MASRTDVETVRAFNRFYTRRMGLTRGGYAKQSLAEARVLYELGANDVHETGDLRARLDIDAGQLSRLLTKLEQRGLAERTPSPTDGRRQAVRLTAAGEQTFAEIDAESAAEITATLDALADPAQVLAAMRALQRAIEPGDQLIIRDREPGDLGWLVERHGVLYTREYGWDESFERLVAQIAADFDPHHDRAWIAEHNGRRAGAVLCVHHDDTTAKLRTLLVEPSARGLGLGTRLVQHVIRHAKAAGYTTLTLWTNDVLHAARHIYEREGFTPTGEQDPDSSFGLPLVQYGRAVAAE